MMLTRLFGKNTGLQWDRYRNGFVSGPYMLMRNAGGGVLASHNGTLLNNGKMLGNLRAAKKFCEAHKGVQT